MSQNHSDSLRQDLQNLTEKELGHIAQATAVLCLALFRLHRPNESLRVYLQGNLGSGKTTWVRSFLRACGVDGRIKSPSFSVAESYCQNGINLHHLDFYRQANPKDWQAGGIRDLLAEPSIVLIEWPERAEGLAPADIELALAPAIETNDDHLRNLQIELKPRFRSVLHPDMLDQWLSALGKISKKAYP